MYKLINCEQGAEKWFQARLGKWTASFFDKALTSTGKPSTQANDVNLKLVAEKIIGQPDDSFVSEAMLRGKELEGEAFDFLNFIRGHTFEAVGFCDSELGYGCSPDGLDVANEMGLELKCPLPHTHLKYLLGGDLPKTYKAQVQGSMLVTGFKKWVFMSYHPQFDPFIIEVERDDEYISQLEKALLKNCFDVKTMFEKYGQGASE